MQSQPIQIKANAGNEKTMPTKIARAGEGSNDTTGAVAGAGGFSCGAEYGFGSTFVLAVLGKALNGMI